MSQGFGGKCELDSIRVGEGCQSKDLGLCMDFF